MNNKINPPIYFVRLDYNADILKFLNAFTLNASIHSLFYSFPFLYLCHIIGNNKIYITATIKESTK